MNEFTDRDDVDRSQVYGLYVIGEGDIETVAQTVFGSQYRDRMRVITAERLLDLLEIQEDSGLRHDQVVDLLLPINAVDVGQLVGLIQDVIEYRGGGGSEISGNGDGGSTVVDGWDGPQTGGNAVQGVISRSELNGLDDATVAVFPSQESGGELTHSHVSLNHSLREETRNWRVQAT